MSDAQCNKCQRVLSGLEIMENKCLACYSVQKTTDIKTKASADSTQAGGNHYKDMAVQPWHVMQSVLTPEEFRGFLKGNIIKYAMRQGKKQDSDDASKCIHYQQKLEEVMERQRQL